MAMSLRISAWNANGLKHHVQEIILFININKIDILLVSESHTTEHTFVKIPHYTIYCSNHPDGTAHVGSEFIIKSAMKPYELQPFIMNKIQGTILRLEVLSRPEVIAAPRHSISAEEYTHFLPQLGTHYLVASDRNSKHTAWGSHLTTVKRRNFFQVIQQSNLSYLSTDEPTYWPTDGNKIPDLLDFAITKGMSDVHTTIESDVDLESDHSALTITVSVNIIRKETPPRLCNRCTNWVQFETYINIYIYIYIY
jgi:exonuclease III